MTQALIPASPEKLALSEPRSLERQPAAVYLAGLARGSRATMRNALDLIAMLLTGGRMTNAFAIDWSQIRFQHTTAVRAKLAERYEAATANKMLSALRGVLKAAWKLDQMSAEDYNRAISFERVRGQALPSGRALKADEIERLLQACARDATPAGARDGSAIAMLCAGGIRRAEVCALKLADYDAAGRILIVRGKRNKQRELPVADGAAAALDDWIAVRGREPGPLFLAVTKTGQIGNRRRHITPQTIYNLLAKRARQAGVRDLSPHDFRRTFVSDLLDAGADLSTVQKLAGHANIQTTQRYDRRGEPAKRKAVELLHVPYVKRGL